MKKKIKLNTNNFPAHPSLLKDPNKPDFLDNIDIDINKLAHHMFIDTYDKSPAYSINPFFLQYQQMLTDDDYFKFLPNGYGSHKESRIFLSNLLGKAMCRLFLSEYADITYFAHMDHMFDKTMTYNSSLGKIRIERCQKGDTPDYFCATANKEPYLAEAKGRKSSISFKNKVFESWRDQFNRVQVVDSTNSNLKYALKGYIIATRYTDETKIQSSIHAEDPFTPGVKEYDYRIKISIGEEVVIHHYSDIVKILGFPMIERALRENLTIEDSEIEVGIWKSPYLSEIEFVGFFIPRHVDSLTYFFPPHFHRIVYYEENLHFFGVEKNIFKNILKIAREGREHIKRVEKFRTIDDIPESIVFLRDGSISGPSDYFKFHNFELL
ncbi:hypothetical protein [Paenibacillus sp. FSL K6-2393]|uniref:hypothetical protein n=1 Tax=Paenibacillus sp. FSL K6-2393 TaxID=2921475 RepID=UPI0030F7B8CF